MTENLLMVCKYFWSDGRWYEGLWKQGKIDKGTIFFPDGKFAEVENGQVQ